MSTNKTTQPSTTNVKKTNKNGRRVALTILPWAILYTLVVLAIGAYFGNQFMNHMHESAKADVASIVATSK